ncbi:MAG: hypothetical protein OIF57_17390, partial [Marinobacterium sp.]|nr:hypothetical protein [Marinobacterium sp.]
MDMQTEVKTLKGDEAVALWKKGREAWNQWVRENPVYNVDFSEVDFTPHRQPRFRLTDKLAKKPSWRRVVYKNFKPLDECWKVDFSGYLFPDG